MKTIPIAANLTGDYLNRLLRDTFESQGKAWERAKELVKELLSKAQPPVPPSWDLDEVIMAVVVGNANFAGSLEDKTLVLDTENQAPIALSHTYKRYAALQAAYSQQYKAVYFAIKDIVDGVPISEVLDRADEMDPTGEAYNLLDALLDALDYEEP